MKETADLLTGLQVSWRFVEGSTDRRVIVYESERGVADVYESERGVEDVYGVKNDPVFSKSQVGEQSSLQERQ